MALRPTKGLRTSNPDGGISRRASRNGAPTGHVPGLQTLAERKVLSGASKALRKSLLWSLLRVSSHFSPQTGDDSTTPCLASPPNVTKDSQQKLELGVHIQDLGQSRWSVTFTSICPLSSHRSFMGLAGFRPGLRARVCARGNQKMLLLLSCLTLWLFLLYSRPWSGLVPL